VTTFERITALCLALPEATVAAAGDRHTAYSVRKRIFAYHLVDHHGDGRTALCAKVPTGENGELVADDPVRWFMPAYLGPRGWVALDLDAAAPDWDEIRTLVTTSYRQVAPKTLARLVE
jgi:phosphoribosylglycinamide formyltransferase-1